jgi:glutaredoxin
MLPAPSGFTIFSKSDCTFCTKAKALLPDATIVECDDALRDRDAFLTHMETLIGRPYRMFPMVFLDGHFLGGYEETKAYLAIITFEDF